MSTNHENTIMVDDAPGGSRETPEAAAEAGEVNMNESTGPDNRTLESWADMLKQGRGAGGDRPGLPVLPPEPTGDADPEAESIMRAVRRFHQGAGAEGETLRVPEDGFIPALLHPFRNHEKIRHDYPLVLLPPGATDNDRLFVPLSEWLGEAIEAFAPNDDDARILKDNRSRLEMHVHESLAGTDDPVDANGCLTNAGAEILAELSLNEKNARQLRDDLEKVVKTVPEGATLLSLNADTVVRLFIHAARHRASARRADLRDRIDRMGNKIHDLLRADHEKEPEGRDPESLGRAVGVASAAHFDPEQLAKVIGSARGAEPMKPDRLLRLRNVHAVLERFRSDLDEQPVLVVLGDPDHRALSDADVDWREIDADPCRTATSIFDEQAQRYAELFGAMRVGRLELAETYDPTRHDALLESFGWEFFAREESLAMPPVLVLESSARLMGSGLFDLSRLLLSGRNVDILVTTQPAQDPNLDPGEAHFAGNRMELAYLGISHREAQVHQTSAARPHHLFEGMLCSLDSTCPALHVVAERSTAGPTAPLLGAWMLSAAALEGRAHPHSHYNPQAGATWARRFDFSDNPQAEADWPSYDLPCRTSEGREDVRTMAFTFADYALLEPRYRDHYRVIPPTCAGDDLIELDRYLALDQAEAEDRVPFIWAADAPGSLHRVVVSYGMVVACRDRLDYWRTLQELAGIRNEHVREAVEYEREKMRAEFEVERQQLEQRLAAEIDRVRDETAAQAYQRLAQALLGTDVSALAGAMTRSPGAAAPPASPAVSPGEQVETAPSAPDSEATQETAPAAIEDEEELDEPWIDTPLCTSCNDCMQVNAQVFLYNANKQAYIGDARAGTFAQLVKAAELCPARCIHPGKPLNPDEPGLEELLERAKPFR